MICYATEPVGTLRPAGRWVGAREESEADMPTWLLGVLVVLLSVLLAVAGLLLIRRLLPRTLLASHVEATYTIHQAIAMVFGVAVCLALLLSWEQLHTAEGTTPR